MDINSILHVLTLLFVASYLLYLFKIILLPKSRTVIASANQELDILRNKPVKTLEEQKAFLDKRYPKSEDWLFFNWLQWKVWRLVIIQAATFGILVWTLNYICQYFSYTTNWITFMIIIFVIPVLMHIILKKCNLAPPNPLFDMFIK